MNAELQALEENVTVLGRLRQTADRRARAADSNQDETGPDSDIEDSDSNQGGNHSETNDLNREQ